MPSHMTEDRSPSFLSTTLIGSFVLIDRGKGAESGNSG